MPSLCDTCRAPGACCRALTLTGDNGALGPAASGLELTALMALSWLPFAPLLRHPDGVMVFWCSNLGADGRCADYAHRPELCRDYQEGSGVICVESPDSVGPSAIVRRKRVRASARQAASPNAG